MIRMFIYAVVVVLACGLASAESTLLPKSVPDGWHYQCAISVFLEAHMTSTVIESTGKCTVMRSTYGAGAQSTDLTHHLSPDDLNEIYHLAYAAICTLKPSEHDKTGVYIAPDKEAPFYSHVTVGLRIGPDPKNGFRVSAFEESLDLKQSHFAKILACIVKYMPQQPAEELSPAAARQTKP